MRAHRSGVSGFVVRQRVDGDSDEGQWLAAGAPRQRLVDLRRTKRLWGKQASSEERAVRSLEQEASGEGRALGN